MREVPAVPTRLPSGRADARWARCTGVLVLLVIAALGVRARAAGQLDSTAHPVVHGGWAGPVVGAVVLAVGLLLSALLLLPLWRRARRRRRRGDAEPPRAPYEPPGGVASRLWALGAVVLLLGLMGSAVVLAIRATSTGGGAEPVSGVDSPRPRTRPVGPGTTLVGTWWWLAAVGIVLAVTVTVLLLARRARHRSPPTSPAPLSSSTTHGGTGVSGRILGSDPRSQVIAQYLAVEEKLAGQLRRDPSETPAEFLGRADRLGQGGAQFRRLADLFARARYSSHTITPGEQIEAQQAGAAVHPRGSRPGGSETAGGEPA